jgi:hypothetical protein
MKSTEKTSDLCDSRLGFERGAAAAMNFDFSYVNNWSLLSLFITCQIFCSPKNFLLVSLLSLGDFGGQG